MINYYEVIAYCNRHAISVEEYFLLYRIYSKQINNKKLVSFNVQSKLYELNNKVKIDYSKLFISLIDKKLIVKIVEKESLKLSNIRVTDDYIKTVFINKEIAFQESLECFPDYMVVEGKKINSKTSKVGGAAYLEELYYKTIGANPIEHNKFIMLVQYKYSNKEYADQKFETLILNWKILRTQYYKEFIKKQGEDGTKRA
jgi:hypothetical protein